MTDLEVEVYATLVRSPIHARTWVPFLPYVEVYDSAFAGPLRLVKERAYEAVQQQGGPECRWVRENDDWLLVAVES